MISSFSPAPIVRSRKRTAPVAGSEREHRLDRVADAGPDRRDVIGLAPRAPASGAAPSGPRRGRRRARPARADRAPASGTAPRARRCARPCGRPRRAGCAAPSPRPGTSCSRAAGASSRSRSSNRDSSSSSSMSSRPGSRRRAFSSTSVAAISRNSVADSRSTRCMRSTSAQNASTMRASEISQRSTSSLRIRCRRRSNGPSKTGVDDLVGHGCRVSNRLRQSTHLRPARPKWPGETPTSPVVCAVVARVFSGIQPTGEMHLGNFIGAVRRWVDDQPAAGSPGAPSATTRSSASSTCTR